MTRTREGSERDEFFLDHRAYCGECGWVLDRCDCTPCDRCNQAVNPTKLAPEGSRWLCPSCQSDASARRRLLKLHAGEHAVFVEAAK